MNIIPASLGKSQLLKLDGHIWKYNGLEEGESRAWAIVGVDEIASEEVKDMKVVPLEGDLLDHTEFALECDAFVFGTDQDDAVWFYRRNHTFVPFLLGRKVWVGADHFISGREPVEETNKKRDSCLPWYKKFLTVFN